MALLLHTAMAFLQGFPMLNCGDEIAQRNGWDYQNDPDRVEDSHNPGVLALVRKRGEETLVGLFNFTEYPAGASLDALGGEYHTPEGTSVWLADVELEPYQALLVKNK